MQRRLKILMLWLLAAVATGAVFFMVPPLAQDAGYHAFADTRRLLGVANFMDVASNIFFLPVALAGIVVAARGGYAPVMRLMWLVMFAGVFATGIGSAFYHLAPDNRSLVWDRLPMTVVFMTLTSGILAFHIGRGGYILWPVLLALGAGSIALWQVTEAAGMGDLRAYGLVQFLPVPVILTVFLLFPKDGARYVVMALGCYGLSKLAEYYDRGIFDLTAGLLGGHSLKHLLAAGAVACLLPYVARAKQPASG